MTPVVIWTMPAPCVGGEPCYCDPDDPNVTIVPHDDPNPYWIRRTWWELHPMATSATFWALTTVLYAVAGGVVWTIGRWLW